VSASQINTAGSASAPLFVSSVLSEYMTPEELAGELGICKRTLDRWHSSRSWSAALLRWQEAHVPARVSFPMAPQA